MVGCLEIYFSIGVQCHLYGRLTFMGSGRSFGIFTSKTHSDFSILSSDGFRAFACSLSICEYYADCICWKIPNDYFFAGGAVFIPRKVKLFSLVRDMPINCVYLFDLLNVTIPLNSSLLSPTNCIFLIKSPYNSENHFFPSNILLFL